LAVAPDFFDENEPAAASLGGDTGRARAREQVEHDVARLGKRFDEWSNGNDGLLIRVKPVARVFPR
jgi:hypothetical protein